MKKNTEPKSYKDPTNTKVVKILNLRQVSMDAWQKNITNSELCQDYLIHEHYTQDQKDIAQKFNKPLLRYNIVLSKILALQGHEQVNRRVAKILARYSDDERVSRILNDNYNAICDNEALENKMNLAHIDALSLCIGGAVRRKIELDEEGYLNFRYEVMNPFHIHYDRFTHTDLSDCEFIVIDDWMTSEQIKSKYKVFPGDPSADNWNEQMSDMGDWDKVEENGIYKVGDRYLVLQLQEREYVDTYLVSIDESEQYENLTDEEIRVHTKNGHKVEMIKPHRSSRIKYTTIIPFMDKVVYEKTQPLPTTRFDIFPIFSYQFNIQKNKMPSLLYVLIDIQDRINKGMNQQVDFVTQALGMPWHVPKTERTVISELRNKGNLPNLVLEYVSINNKAERSQPPQIPPAILQTVNVDQMFLNDISNITPAMEGRTERSGEPGVLYDAKLRESKTITNPYFEIKADLRNRLAEDYVELAPYVYFEDERPLQVKGESGQLDYVMVNLEYSGVTYNDVRKVKAKAKLDEGDNTKTALEEQFEENMILVTTLLKSGATFIDIPWEAVLKNSPIKDKDKFIAYLKQRQVIMDNIKTNEVATNELANMSKIASMMQPPAANTQGV